MKNLFCESKQPFSNVKKIVFFCFVRNVNIKVQLLVVNFDVTILSLKFHRIFNQSDLFVKKRDFDNQIEQKIK